MAAAIAIAGVVTSGDKYLTKLLYYLQTLVKFLKKIYE